jgi:predicted membrane-bound mannosyltransferase
MPVSLRGTGGGSVELTSGAAAASTTLTLPNTTGNVLASTAVSSSTTNTVTNKIAVSIGGTTYYILASTSGT